MIARREFISLLGGAAATWPMAARAQQRGGMQKVGMLSGFTEGDPVGAALVTAFRQSLHDLGWEDGRNVRIEVRWAQDADPERMRIYAAELVELGPDVIVVHGGRALTAVQQVSRDVPLVFASITDPIGLGYVESLARPGGNVTGFATFDGSSALKLLEALKEIAPRVARVAFVTSLDGSRVPDMNLLAFERAAPSFGVQPVAARVHSPAEIEPAIEAFAREPNGALLVSADVVITSHRDLVVALAAKHRLPAAYNDPAFVKAGGLMSYSVNRVDQYRRVATYVDRILKGAKPADLPVQQPTKFEFVINSKTASALGLSVPTGLLLRADEVIE